MSNKNYPLIKECHCSHTADKYYNRKFTNKANYTVHRVFYRCRNCRSRIYEDFIPELDEMQRVSVLDLIKNKNNLNHVKN